jgi:hypothetical protein
VAAKFQQEGSEAGATGQDRRGIDIVVACEMVVQLDCGLYLELPSVVRMFRRRGRRFKMSHDFTPDVREGARKAVT